MSLGTKLAPDRGFKPRTTALTVRGSIAELIGNNKMDKTRLEAHFLPSEPPTDVASGRFGRRVWSGACNAIGIAVDESLKMVAAERVELLAKGNELMRLVRMTGPNSQPQS